MLACRAQHLFATLCHSRGAVCGVLRLLWVLAGGSSYTLLCIHTRTCARKYTRTYAPYPCVLSHLVTDGNRQHDIYFGHEASFIRNISFAAETSTRLCPTQTAYDAPCSTLQHVWTRRQYPVLLCFRPFRFRPWFWLCRPSYIESRVYNRHAVHR